MNQHPLIARLTFLQTLVVLIGVMMTTLHFKISGYPAADLDWNPLAVAVAVRDFGYFLLLLPAVWAIASLVLERRDLRCWPPLAIWISGIGLMLALAVFLYWTFTTPFHFHGYWVR